MIERPIVGEIVSPHYPGCLAAVVLDVRASVHWVIQRDPNKHPLDYTIREPLWEGWRWCVSVRVRYLESGKIFRFDRNNLYRGNSYGD